jgi:hypothetical protein
MTFLIHTVTIVAKENDFQDFFLPIGVRDILMFSMLINLLLLLLLPPMVTWMSI